ncbi:MAG: hypothetical protein AAB243_04755 [Planctomycetota bacterium]
MMPNIETESLIDRENSRRKSIRYAHGNMFVTVRRHSFIKMFQKPYIVNWMDFNQHGMAFVSDHRYKTGCELLIELSIDDSNKKSLSEVVGVVTNTKEEAGNYRCGIKFNFDANDYMKSDVVKQSLQSIELWLREVFSRLHERRQR